MSAAESVGPVLHATPFARTVISAIRDENEQVVVQDEGAYLRVLVPRVCRLSRAGIEALKRAADFDLAIARSKSVT